MKALITALALATLVAIPILLQPASAALKQPQLRGTPAHYH